LNPPQAGHRQLRNGRDAATGEPVAVCFTTQDLFAGSKEIEILHRDSRYRLRQTSSGKLILTK
jgi:hemin uptake protein HemP